MRDILPRLLLPLVFVAAALLVVQPPDAGAAKGPKRLLVVTVTKGFRHDSIPTAEKVIGELAAQSGKFTVDYARTDDELRAKTTAEALAGYDGVFFAQTTGDLPVADRDAFVAWVKAGHGFVGMHSASDTFHGFEPYVSMVGGEFDHHGEQATVRVLVEDTKAPGAAGLEPAFETHDEIYLFKNFSREAVHMVLALDKHPNTGEAGFYPLAWTREVGKGRMFYTALGHRDDVIESAWYRKHVLGGVLWALQSS
jgi:type 1 glutamine amidotransferase